MSTIFTNDVPANGGARRPRGRPPRFNKRANFNFRITDHTRQRLVAACETSGRSLSEEIEHRVDRSFRDDEFERIERILAELAALVRVAKRKATS